MINYGLLDFQDQVFNIFCLNKIKKFTIKNFKNIIFNKKIYINIKGTAFGSPFLGEIIMFSMPVAFAIIGGIHQDYRYRRNIGGYMSKEMEE